MKAEQFVSSADDSRTANNSVRHTYRVLSDEEKRLMVEIKDLGVGFIAKCNEVDSHIWPDGLGTPHYQAREIGIAIQKIEEAVMWAVKALTK